MNKENLKLAMQKLDVKTPLKLRSPTPSFKAPEENSSLGANQTPGLKSTQVENGPGVQNPPRCEMDPRLEIDPGARNHLGGNQPPGLEHTQVLYQASSVTMDSKLSDALARGYTRIPNTLLLKLISGELNRNEIKVALLIARFTISFRRKSAPISKSVIEKRTNIKSSCVLDAINGLIAKNIIQKISGDQNTPNQLALIMSEEDEQTMVESGPGVQNPPRLKVDPGSENNPGVYQPPGLELTQTQGPKSTYPWVGNRPPFKDIYKNNIKNTSSSRLVEIGELECENLREYFQSLKAPTKTTSEWDNFLELKEKFSETEISQALAHVQTHGVLFSKEPCHSPMKYLASAMNDVLNEVKRMQDECSAARTKNEMQENAIAVEKRKLKQIEIDRTIREAEFQKLLPSQEDQKRIILEFASRNPPLSPESKIARSLAIQDWWAHKE